MSEQHEESFFIIIQLIHERSPDIPPECIPTKCHNYAVVGRIHQICQLHYSKTDAMVRAFNHDDSNWADNLWQTCLSFFPNLDISWHRISVLLAYTVSLYIHMADHGYNYNRLGDILSIVDVFFDQYLEGWIASVGGWNAFKSGQNFFVRTISFMYKVILSLLR